jgi:hypothetical protein
LKKGDTSIIIQANKEIEGKHTSTALLEILLSVQTQNSSCFSFSWSNSFAGYCLGCHPAADTFCQ